MYANFELTDSFLLPKSVSLVLHVQILKNRLHFFFLATQLHYTYKYSKNTAK